MKYETREEAERPGIGLAVSLSKEENGCSRLIIDDIYRQLGMDTTGWAHGNLFTQIELKSSALESLSLDKDKLAQIGENILIRLLALNERSG